MDYIQILLCTLAAYLIGSIPTSVWIGKVIYGIDIRDHGKGNASHINVQNILGRRSGIVVRSIDILKGVIAAKLAFFVHNQYGIFSDLEYPILMMTFGLAAILGHIFPIFAGFRGGKGFHVSLGVLAAINPIATAIFASIALLIFLVSRYPDLGYVAGGIAVPVFFIATAKLYGYLFVPTLIFALLISMMLFATHRQELAGILHGTEAKAPLKFGKLFRV